MKLETQVCSLDPAKKLKELGVKQESLFLYDMHGNICFSNGNWDMSYCTSAFTVTELGELLPMIYIPVRDGKKGWLWSCDGKRNYEDTEADARAKILVYLLENKLATLNHEN